MNVYWYCLLSKAIAISGFVVLVIFDHPLLGTLCLLFAASIDGPMKNTK